MQLPSSAWRCSGSPPRHERRDSLQLAFEASEDTESFCSITDAMERQGSALELPRQPSSAWRSVSSPPRHQCKDSLQLAFEASEPSASAIGLCLPSPPKQCREEPWLTTEEVSTIAIDSFREVSETSPSVAEESCPGLRREYALDLPSSNWRIDGSPRGPAQERKDSLQLTLQVAAPSASPRGERYYEVASRRERDSAYYAKAAMFGTALEKAFPERNYGIESLSWHLEAGPAEQPGIHKSLPTVFGDHASAPPVSWRESMISLDALPAPPSAKANQDSPKSHKDGFRSALRAMAGGA